MKKTAIIIVLLLTGRMVSAQAYLITRKVKEPTRGSRYFFAGFVRGALINSKGLLIKNPGYTYNYDKMSGVLLLKSANQPIMLASKADIQSFTLYNRERNAFVFEKVPAIDTGRYAQVLALGLKYKVYKLIRTQFTRSNYRNDGVITEGNKYDEYVDEGKYYVLNVTTNSLQPIKLKLSSLKSAFPADEDKLNQFISLHPLDTIGDVYLGSLGEFMNN